MDNKTLVLGVGNTLLSDEGVGVHVIRYLQDHHPLPGVDYMDGGTLSFTLAQAIEDTDNLIVVDAAQLRAPAGSVHVFRDAEMDRFLGEHRKRSVHEVSLIDLMAVACLAEHMPSRRALIGIQPAVLDWGEAPSPALRAAIPAAGALALELIAEWTRATVPA